jgi:photosystem II stability/assembly factor-like uncharacterized protein
VKNSILINTIIISLFSFPCLTKSQMIDTISKNHFYSNEIFDDKYLDLYNTWVLTDISGGFIGSGYEVDYDYLIIDSIGIFKIFSNDSLQIFGKISILNQTEDELLISLESVYNTNQVSFSDMTKYVMLSDDSLILMAPCCDRFDYHFTKCENFDYENYFQELKYLDDLIFSSGSISYFHNPSIFFIDEDIGFIAPDLGGEIYKTIDGGLTWQLKYTPNDINLLHRIYFFNHTIGYAVGGTLSGALILRTQNEGNTWEPINIQDVEMLYDVNFINNNIGFAVGDGKVIRTLDAGNTWEIFDVGIEGRVLDIEFINDSLGFACGIDKLIKTTDGGLNWQNIEINIPGFPNINFLINTIRFIDENNGFIGTRGPIIKTKDSGLHWEIMDDSPELVSDLFIDKDNRLIAIGRREFFYSNCAFFPSFFNISSQDFNHWMGDNRINKMPIAICQIDSTAYVGVLPGNKLFKIKFIESAVIKSVWENKPVSIYPNPASDCFTISLGNGKEIQRVEVFNIYGEIQRRINKINDHELTITSETLSSGIYFIRIYSSEIYTEKVIIR